MEREPAGVLCTTCQTIHPLRRCNPSDCWKCAKEVVCIVACRRGKEPAPPPPTTEKRPYKRRLVNEHGIPVLEEWDDSDEEAWIEEKIGALEGFGEVQQTKPFKPTREVYGEDRIFKYNAPLVNLKNSTLGPRRVEEHNSIALPELEGPSLQSLKYKGTDIAGRGNSNLLHHNQIAAIAEAQRKLGINIPRLKGLPVQPFRPVKAKVPKPPKPIQPVLPVPTEAVLPRPPPPTQDITTQYGIFKNAVAAPPSAALEGQPGCPILTIDSRRVVAVEHPMVIRNTENGLKTFGLGQPFERILSSDDADGCVPLYLRYNDPLSAPILSHNVSTSNVVIKVTVPKRTGRKRKRGSQEPYSYSADTNTDNYNNDLTETTSHAISLSANVGSQERKDNPAELLSVLKENVGRYSIEAIANVQRTHRFRGPADFLQSSGDATIIPKMQEIVHSGGDMTTMRQLKIDLNTNWQLGQDFIPPPFYITTALPIVTGDEVDEEEPHKDKIARISKQKPPTSKLVQERIRDLSALFRDRAICTRRYLGNQFPQSLDRRDFSLNEAIKHVAYPIKDGPFRDTLCRFGIDPRGKKRYRKYQTLSFMLGEEKKLRDVPEDFTGAEEDDLSSHIFDGKRVNMKASCWQVVDLVDPLLARLRDKSPYREEFDPVSGYFHNGSWAKIRAVMRVKLEAIVTNTVCLDEWFENSTLKEPDKVELNHKWRNGQRIRIPDIFRIAEERNDRIKNGEGYMDIGKDVPTTTLEKLRKSAKSATASRRNLTAAQQIEANSGPGRVLDQQSSGAAQTAGEQNDES